MNDALVAAIRNAVPGLSPMGLKDAANAVRAWLSLPPSEEEIAAGANALWTHRIVAEAGSAFVEPWDGRITDTTTTTQIAAWNVASLVLSASRAVLVRPPEDEKGTT